MPSRRRDGAVVDGRRAEGSPPYGYIFRDCHDKTKKHTHPDNRTKYAPWYHLNSRKDAHSLPRNAGQTEQLNENSAVLLQSDLLLPRRGACTDRTLSKRAKEKYSSFSWHLCINFNIIAVKFGFVKGYDLFFGTAWEATGLPYDLSSACCKPVGATIGRPHTVLPFGIIFILCPSARIIQNIIIFHSVIRIIPNNMVVKRPLPYGTANLFADKSF